MIDPNPPRNLDCRLRFCPPNTTLIARSQLALQFMKGALVTRIWLCSAIFSSLGKVPLTWRAGSPPHPPRKPLKASVFLAHAPGFPIEPAKQRYFRATVQQI